MKLLYRMSLTTHWSSLPVVRSQPHTGPLRYVRGANVYDALELAGGAQGGPTRARGCLSWDRC